MKTTLRHLPSALVTRLRWLALLLAVASFTPVPSVFATSGTWSNDGSSVWSNPANWLSGAIANGTDATADFSTINISADRTVTLDSARSVGTLRFSGGAGAHNWFLNSSGGSALALAVSSGSPTIAVTNTATINAPLAGAAGLTKTGPGTLTLGTNNPYTGTTAISGGTVNQPAPTNGALVVATPVLYMSFDKVIGTTVNNEGSGGSAMNGTLIGSASVVNGGRLGGNCLSVGSGWGYVLVTNPVVAMTGAGTWSVGMWMKTTTAGGGYLYQGSGGWGSGNMAFYLNPGGGSAGTHAGGVSFAQGWEQGSTTINDGNWHFVVMTCNGTTKAMYVDGNVDTIATSWLANTGVGNQLWIGGTYDRTAGEVGFNGLIDEVSMYNTALSQAQVQTLMAAGTSQGTVPAGSAVSVATASTLDLVGNWQTLAGLSGAGTVDSTLAGGAPFLTVNNSTTTASTFGGVINNTAGSSRSSRRARTA